MIDAYTTRNFRDAVQTDLNAYNAAFYQLGLRWHWDLDTYTRLLDISDDAAERVQWYLRSAQPHLLTAYDADFLAGAIETAKAECRKAMRASTSRSLNCLNWAEIQTAEVGV